VLGRGCSRVIGVRVKGVRIRAVVVRVRLLRTELVLQLEFWVRVEHEADARDGDFRGGEGVGVQGANVIQLIDPV